MSRLEPLVFRAGDVQVLKWCCAPRQGMNEVMWSADSRDWAQPGYLSASATATIVRNATDLRYSDVNHPIVLMHVGKASYEPESKVSSFRGNTLAALPTIIAWYQARGYRFVDMYNRS